MDSSPVLRADLHVHTIASGHAYSTIEEVCEAASGRFDAIAITDHGPAMPGGPHVYHFSNLLVLPGTIRGVRVFKGAECNILDSSGLLDLHFRVIRSLDIVLAAIHPFCGYEGSSEEENTRAVVNAVKSGMVDVLAHPCNPLYPVDYTRVVRAAAEHRVALEVNNASFTVVRKGSEGNCRAILAEAVRTGAFISVGSDAHHATMVGWLDRAQAMVEQAGIDPGQVINRNLDSVIEFLKIRGKDIDPGGYNY